MQPNRHFLALDFAADCPMADFLVPLEKYHLSIHSFIAVGPGGGNPCVTLASAERSMLVEFLRAERSDDSEFLIGHIQTLSFA